MQTLFASVYNRFLGKITEDMYLELTPEDTIRDLQNLLINAIPEFEFPRCNLYDYKIEIAEINEDELLPDDFILGTVWGELSPTYFARNLRLCKHMYSLKERLMLPVLHKLKHSLTSLLFFKFFS